MIQMYDRSIKCFSESYTPEQMVNENRIHKGKLLSFQHKDSYLLQIKTIYSLKPGSVLEIGAGEAIGAYYLGSLGLKYDLFKGDITKDTTKKKYDLVAAFQVLEHQPLKQLVFTLKNMASMSNKHVLISVPYFRIGASLRFRLVLGQNYQISKKIGLFIPVFKKNKRYRKEFLKEFPYGGHYWEIGRAGVTPGSIKKRFKAAGLKVIKTFSSENPYHYFILAEKKTGGKRVL
jgi:hypothetical protein